jgi:hypothetical protein
VTVFELGGVGPAAAGTEQLGGAQDQQGGGGVAQLEDSHADHEPPQVAAQDGADLDADRLVGPRPGR